MNIFFDARWTRTDQHFGVSRFGAELATALAKHHPITLIIYDERQLKLLPPGVPYVKLNNPLSVSELTIARKLNSLGADVVFTPLQLMGGFGRKYKLIVTLHDLIYYKHRTPWSELNILARTAWWLFYAAYWPQRLVLNMADHVVTVSQTSKQEILQHHLTDRPVSVVYNAPGIGQKSPSQPTKKELVYMGSFMPYKNVELLLRGMALLPGYHLHVISRVSPERKQQLQSLIKDPSQVTFWNGLDDDGYKTLLASATALVTASKAEGFGLPTVEAISQGVPVICTDMPIFHEVCGDGALYFDPDSPDSFAQAVRQLDDPAFRKDLIANGAEHIQKFTWDASAKELLRVMRDVTQ